MYGPQRRRRARRRRGELERTAQSSRARGLPTLRPTSASREPPLRRSARLNPPAPAASAHRDIAPERAGQQSDRAQAGSRGHDLRARAAEAEMARLQQRRDSRRTRDGGEASGAVGASTSSVQEHPPLPRSPRPTDASPRPDGILLDKRGAMDMRIISHPSRECYQDEVLQPALTIRIRRASSAERSCGPEFDMTRMWAMASLVDEETRETLAPPREDLLRGQLTRSTYMESASSEANEGVASAETAEITEGGSFVTFSDLAILEPGRYRIRLTLVEMQGETGISSTTEPGGWSLQDILSEVIEVRDRPGTAEVSKSVSSCEKQAAGRGSCGLL